MKKKLLLVDDENEIRGFMSEYFSERGYEIFTADCGAAAVEQAEKTNPDLILLDVQMPGMSGLDALKKIREKNILSKVIMVTGCNEAKIIEQIMRLGADHYLIKPLTLAYLETQIKEVLKK